ncbi:hypothetical protein MLD38_033006 [Melastoma candidum]|uniref:Uncharacterized protein n=1 Tax=Melastoma candidum TaxID=119954 RepID=A0ACB9M5E9_9MYRT|nr:hypothetical protein MLD38_033006 [Melastoma candidum]
MKSSFPLSISASTVLLASLLFEPSVGDLTTESTGAVDLCQGTTAKCTAEDETYELDLDVVLRLTLALADAAPSHGSATKGASNYRGSNTVSFVPSFSCIIYGSLRGIPNFSQSLSSFSSLSPSNPTPHTFRVVRLGFGGAEFGK